MEVRRGGLKPCGMRRHYTAEKRAQLVELVTSTGATIAAAAAELGVQKSTASYWVRKATKPTRRARRSRLAASATASATASTASAAEPAFARLVCGSETAPSIEVRAGKVAIRVRPGFDAELLRAVVAALSEGAA
jgi:transposase-like protein